MRVVRGYWRPRSVESGVKSVIIGRTVQVRYTLLWRCRSLPLTGVPGSRPMALGVGVKTRGAGQNSEGLVLLDSFLSLLRLCRVLSVLRVGAWLVLASLATAGASSEQGPYAPQGRTSLLPKLSVTLKVRARTSYARVGSRVHFRSSEDVTLLEFTSPVDREYMRRRRKFY